MIEPEESNYAMYVLLRAACGLPQLPLTEDDWNTLGPIEQTERIEALRRAVSRLRLHLDATGGSTA
jgi:hypothetical protein